MQQALASAAVALVSSCGGDTEEAFGPGVAADAGVDPDAAATDAGADILADAAQDHTAQDAPGDALADVSVDVPQDQSPACAPPTDPAKSALCLTLSPEALTLIPGDPALDGQGVWLVQLFDTANPELPDGGEPVPLAMQIIPEQDGGADPVLTGVYDDSGVLRFDDLPPQVYVRAKAHAMAHRQPHIGCLMHGLRRAFSLVQAWS